MKILIYTKVPCPFCTRAKAFFKNKGWSYEEKDLTDQFDAMDELKTRTGHMTFPQIFIDDKFIGGYDDLVEKFKS